LNVSWQLSRHTPSAHRFDFAVTLCIIGVLATLLLHYLNEVQADIEKVTLKTELNNLQLSLAEAWIHKSVTHQLIDIEALKDSNPMLLIATKPGNYIGESPQTPKASKAIWYFDTRKKQLIYVFNDGQQASYKLVGTTGQTSTSLVSAGGLDLAPDVKKIK
jgi:hypothetical protein